jgi:hypothetical protein
MEKQVPCRAPRPTPVRPSGPPRPTVTENWRAHDPWRREPPASGTARGAGSAAATAKNGPHASGLVLTGKYDPLKKQRQVGKALRTRMMKMLDGEFGDEAGAFEKKEPYGYDRRVTPAPSRGKRKSDPAPATETPKDPPAAAATGTDTKVTPD